MILLSRPISLNPAKIEACFATRHPGVENEIFDRTERGAHIWRIASNILAVLNFDAPIPSGWEPLASRARPFFAEAHEVCAQHRAHLIVSAMGIEHSRLQTARYTTAAVDAIVHAYPEAVAVIWDLAVVQPRRAYETAGHEALGKYLPFPLWIGIHSFRDERTNVVAMTIGLRHFVGREIEIEGPTAEISTIHQKLIGLIEYTLTRVSPIKDGDTVGVSERERIRVRHCRSIRSGVPILALSLPGTIPAAFKKYPIISHALAQADPMLRALKALDLFDVQAESNQVALQSDAFVSEQRMDSYDAGLASIITQISQSGSYQESQAKARRVLDSGDMGAVKAILAPYADEIRRCQDTMRFALTRGDVFMFQPKVAPSAS